jgi:DNA-binding winged helix-turn-helix (wHTH) protein
MYVPITESIEIDRDRQSVRTEDREIHLTGLEFGMLEFLATRPNRICSREELLDHVWGGRFLYDTGTIDVHLNALRRKMGWNNKRPIETVRGVGLIFRNERATERYTIDLQHFLHQWLQTHETEIRAAGLVAQLHMTPFVNELTIAPETLTRMLDGILSALLSGSQPGIFKITTRLTVHHFSLALDVNGTINELRIPIYGEFEAS